MLEKFARKNVPKARNINARQTLSIKCSVMWRMVFVNLPIVATLTSKEPLEVEVEVKRIDVIKVMYLEPMIYRHRMLKRLNDSQCILSTNVHILSLRR